MSKTIEELRADADLCNARVLEFARHVVGPAVGVTVAEFNRRRVLLNEALAAYDKASDAWFWAIAEKHAARKRARAGGVA